MLLAALAACVVAACLWPADAGARANGGIDVVQVNGLLDPANAALVRSSLRNAAANHSSVVVFQLDGTGAVDTDVVALQHAVANSPVPVGIWVGPSGGGARGASAVLALSAPVVAVAPGAGIGPLEPLRLDHPGSPPLTDVLSPLRTAQARAGRDVAALGTVAGRRLSATEARELKLVDGTQPTVGDFIVSLDGRTVHTAHGDVKLDTATVVGEGAQRRLQPKGQIRFHKLDLSQQLAHTLVTPWVAYFLFVAGLSLILFEFFTVGVGIAGVARRGRGRRRVLRLLAPPRQRVWRWPCSSSGCSGWRSTSRRAVSGPWTFIGVGALVAGSIWLYGGSSRLDPAWWIVVFVCGATVVFVLSGMTAMVRSRFSTPTIGREELIGEMGTAEVDVAPDGVVRVRDALWRGTDQSSDADQGRRRHSGRRGRGRGARGRARERRGARLPGAVRTPLAAVLSAPRSRG